MDDDSDHMGSNSNNVTLRFNARFLLDVATAVTDVVGARYEVKECRTSSLTGKQYIAELLAPSTNSRRVLEVLRMSREIFLELCQWLEDRGLLTSTRFVNVDEQVAMFVWTIGHNASNRDVQERFQHSGDTVSR